MGTIQAGINQLIGLAAIGGKFYADSPAGMKAAELRDIKSSNARLEKDISKIDDRGYGPGANAETTAAHQAKNKIEERIASNLERKAELDPTLQNIKTSVQARDAYLSRIGKEEEDLELYKMYGEDENADRIASEQDAPSQWITPDRAQAKMAKKGINQARQRATYRKFMDYLRDEPVSLGGTVGDYPPEMQKKIAANYSSSQRKKLMDMKDAQRKKESDK